MSSTLASLGLPEPEPVKPQAAAGDTLASLGLPEPERPRGGRSRGKGGGASWPDPYSPEEIARRDQPIVDEGLGPGALLFAMPAGAAGYKAGEILTGPLKAWLLNRALRGAASGAAAGGVEAASREANPAPYVLGGAAGGALLGPAVEAAIPAAGRLRTGLRGRATATPKPPISPVEPTSAPPVAKGPVNPGSASTGVPVPPAQPKAIPAPGPVTGANAQQFPALGEFVEQVKADPAYLARVKELGGGRVVSNKETLARAAEAGPMDPAELAAWPADAPIDPVTQTRALLTFDHFQQARTRAIAAGDLKAAADAQRTIAGLMPGVTNLRATGGRVTQAQAMFVQDEMSKILDSLADMQAKGVPFEQVQTKANEMLRQAEVAARGKRLSSEWREALGGIETAATFAKLTSPVTHAVNTISNALTFGVVRPLEKAGTALAYLGQGNAPAARAEVSTLFGTRMGFRSGFERYIKTLMDDLPDPGKMIEVNKGRNIPLPRALRPFDVFRQLAAADGFWKGVLRDARLHELAHRSAAGEGLQGPALAARIKELVDDPPAPWAAEADTYAKEFTFQSDPDRFLQAVQKVQGLPFVRLFIPFVQTPYNLARFQFQRSAAGLLSPRNIKGLAAGGQAQAEAIGRLTAGAGLSAGALAFVSTTGATGDYPTDPRERERWKEARIKPYSIRLPNGTWIAYNRFAPVGMYVGQAVALREAMERGNEQGIAGAASTLAASSLKQINDMPFLSGLSDLLDAVKDPDRSAERFGQGIVTGLVPNILRDVRQQADSTMREARGVPQAVQNMIPGLSQRLPASIDVLGRERTYEPSRLLRATKVLTTQRTSPETDLFARLEWSPNAPGLLLERGKEKKKLEGKDAELFKREMGAAVEKGIANARAKHPRLDQMEREEAIEILDAEITKARKPVRKRWTMNILKGR